MDKNKFTAFFIRLYEKLFKINDTPQKVSLGLGLGVAAGILPAVGPVIALFLATLLRVNRAATLIGCLLTNTWLSFLTFVLAVKTGAWLTDSSWQEVMTQWKALYKDFHLANFFKQSFLEIVVPVAIGFLIISLCLGGVVYLVSLPVILFSKRARSKKLDKEVLQ
jgi:uncharacterized protein (DUF2062 family)